MTRLLLAAAAALVVVSEAAGAQEIVEPPYVAHGGGGFLAALLPDFVKAQTGGYEGLLSLGAGYSPLDGMLDASLIYGFTPASSAGVTVHSLAAKLSLRPLELPAGAVRLTPIYGGAGLLFAWGGEGFFLRPPSRYPSRGHYPPTAVHWTAHLGAALDFAPDAPGVVSRHGPYVEATALDTYLLSVIHESRVVALEDALSFAVGYRAQF